LGGKPIDLGTCSVGVKKRKKNNRFKKGTLKATKLDAYMNLGPESKHETVACEANLSTRTTEKHVKLW
jgi:hypothetical protein